MKLSINPAGHGFTFTVTTEHCKRLSNFLWDWYNSIPKEIAKHIEVITVNPINAFAMDCALNIKVVLSGRYQHYYQGCGLEQAGWKTQFDKTVHYSMHEGVDECPEELTNKLRQALEAEIKTYQPLLSDLGSMFEMLSVRY